MPCATHQLALRSFNAVAMFHILGLEDAADGVFVSRNLQTPWFEESRRQLKEENGAANWARWITTDTANASREISFGMIKPGIAINLMEM